MKVDDIVIDLKYIIQTDNTNDTIKSDIDELIYNLCNHNGEFGEFGSKINESSVGCVLKYKLEKIFFISHMWV